MSNPICKCGAPLSEHCVAGQYDGGCLRTKCGYFEEAKSPQKKGARTRQHNAAVAAKREHAALIEERNQLAALCAAWRELAQSRGRAIIAIANKDTAAFDTAAKEAGSAANRLRKLGIPEEQLR